MKASKRSENLMPNGQPRYVRCYDNGGTEVNGGSIDRYTAAFTGRYKKQGREFVYLAMNCAPFHPQGIGQHGESQKQIDVNKSGFAPAIGRKNHLGRRIPFSELPDDCQKLVIRDYVEIWKL